MTLSSKIEIAKIISENLALRDLVSNFFDDLEKMKEKQITIDFKKVKSISRSFAQEYLTRKNTSKKDINEANVPENVEKMFEIINETEKRTPLIDLKTVKIICV
ncbi:MAG: DUF4325 domain-containing protein [Candidatus Diapherotrites archaeon]|nr:DUF4325 domain-containing protein [Candidatus Diapherotrites archaeon]